MMNILVDTTGNIDLSLIPSTIEEEVMQNLWVLYSSMEFDVPLDCELGLNATYIDKPIQTAMALAMNDIYEKTEKYEPRAIIQSIEFDYVEGEPTKGIIRQKVEVAINGEYDQEEDTE